MSLIHTQMEHNKQKNPCKILGCIWPDFYLQCQAEQKKQVYGRWALFQDINVSFWGWGVEVWGFFLSWPVWHLEIPRASCISIFLHCSIYNFLAFYLDESKQLHKLVLQKLFAQEFLLLLEYHPFCFYFFGVECYQSAFLTVLSFHMAA